MIYAAPGIVPLGGDRMALYTQCARLGKDSVERQKSPYHGFAMGRVTFLRDRILGIENRDGEGYFATRSVQFEGRRLELNAERTAPGASLRVELSSMEDGKACPGFTFSDCDPVAADQVHAPVTWRGREGMGEWANRPVRVRFRMKAVRLYAFQFLP